ncbi:hypothetical protein BDY24DRAFT_412021 [Mrakia frigida]|uniref:uncharacterized protein n=1 Tax=Mrakia frigida TaxID=29902 RepID=UPI003FCC25A3
MSFPSLLTTISFATLRGARPSACSLSFARSFSTSNVSLSTSNVSLGLIFGSSSPFISSSPPSTRPHAQQPPSPSRSYHSYPRCNLSSPSQPSLARLSSSSPPSPPPRSSSSSPPTPPRPPRYIPPPPPKHKPWALPKGSGKRTRSDFERMRELQEKDWELRTKLRRLPMEERKELKVLEEMHLDAKIALTEQQFGKLLRFEPMDGRSTNVDLQRWFEELPKKDLTERNVWNEFVLTRTAVATWFCSPRDRPLDNQYHSVRFRDPIVNSGFQVIKPIMVTLLVAFALYLTAAVITDRLYCQSELSGTSSWLLGPWGGWIVVVGLLSIMCIVPHWIKNAKARLDPRSGASQRSIRASLPRMFDLVMVFLNLDRAMNVFKFIPLEGTYLHIWTSMFGHSDNDHITSNLFFLVLSGFFAYSFFDDRSPFTEWISPFSRRFSSWFNETFFNGWFERHDDGWIIPYLRQLPGLLNEDWTLSDVSTPPEPTRRLTGLFHFLVFCLAASAFPLLLFFQVPHELLGIPKAQRTLLSILKDPSKLRSQKPPWDFDPKEKKIRLSHRIMSELDCLSALGISQTVCAVESLALMTMTFGCWNPIFLPLQHHCLDSIYNEIKATWEGASPAGDFGHLPGIVFGLIYFFVGGIVWDWFLDKATLFRPSTRSEDAPSELAPAVETSAGTETENEEQENSTLVEKVELLVPLVPSILPSPPSDPLPTSSEEEVVEVESSSPEPPSKRRGWRWWSS